MKQQSPAERTTIRTHVCSGMCVNAPRHSVVVYDDRVRSRPGKYRLHT